MNKAFERILERLDAKKQYFQKFYDADGKTEEDEFINKATQLAFDDAKNIVQEVAEEYNNGWIPCSERLPEEDGFYLTTVIFKGKSNTCRHWFDKNNGEWLDSDYIPFVNDDISAIIAWQPLPEPYKECD